MRIIKSKQLGQAWQKSIKEIIGFGQIVNDDKGEIKELLDLFILVKKIEKNDPIIKQYGNKKMIKWMLNNFGKTTEVDDWGYSYGQRLYDFKGVNQIKYVISRLKSNPESKSATISFMFPPEDIKHIPCIIAIDFKIRDKKLIVTSFFRSQDIGKKFYADAIAINSIAEKISRSLSIRHQEFLFFIKSAHIYLNDIQILKPILKWL
ncbi:hypothetical protein COS31_00420 [Candidatus Roizmanbacteria bacterium CG02_land_8_20_14_3_00_36_15]|nr:MAG: hypothetical protein COS31_00420 [Candidatus Roizmanbacteria bacterium CG02_land_8_20_14_3_00_36_15]PJA53606.1 MAG: hypothetical protein CO166_01235 [Candidatus Roizmanbacteria bacterium CG_4_9_14_3_um_filter_36_11]